MSTTAHHSAAGGTFPPQLTGRTLPPMFAVTGNKVPASAVHSAAPGSQHLVQGLEEQFGVLAAEHERRPPSDAARRPGQIGR